MIIEIIVINDIMIIVTIKYSYSSSLPGYTKTLGIEWNSRLDQFQITVNKLSQCDKVTKRGFVSDIAKTYVVLGWFSPTIIKVKILLQRVWESGVDWDQEIPQNITEEWLRWRTELKYLSKKLINRYYFSQGCYDKGTPVAWVL